MASGFVAGVADLLRGRPHHPVGADGRMALADHLRELRARLIRSVLVWLVLFIVALFFYDQLLDIIVRPYNEARVRLGEKVTSELVFTGITGPLMVQLKLCAVTALIAASPYWLLQIWGFVMPGLHPNEKRWTRVFGAVAGPMFVLGVATGYYTLPKGIQVLLDFTPLQATNLVEFGEFFSFIIRMLLVFGIAFEIPLFVVMLSLAGVVTGRMLGRYRAWIILGTTIFAAVATPSTDPISMMMLGVPMLVLFLIAEVIARLIDRSRGRGAHRTDQWGDDEVSPL